MVKMNIGGRGAQDTVPILDPSLSKSLTAGQVLATGMDAITHCLETFLSNWDSPITDALAIRALRMLCTYIGRLFGEQPGKPWSHAAGRDHVVLASGNARLGLVHAMPDQVGALHHVSHGVSNALMLPTVMEYNLPRDIFAELAWATSDTSSRTQTPRRS
jgi:alcohol dehydrogenase